VPSFAKKRLPTSGARNQVEEALDETFVTVCETVVTVKHFDHGPIAAESSLSKPSFEWSDCLDTHEFSKTPTKIWSKNLREGDLFTETPLCNGSYLTGAFDV
jgi:hypothetical protein